MALIRNERLVRTVRNHEVEDCLKHLNGRVSDFEKKRLNTRYIAIPIPISKVEWINILRAGCKEIICITEKEVTK